MIKPTDALIYQIYFCQETLHVEFLDKNKFGKLVRLLGILKIKVCVDIFPSEVFDIGLVICAIYCLLMDAYDACRLRLPLLKHA